MEVKIRYNNTCADGKNFWRVIIDGKEEIASEVIINCVSRTTTDLIHSVKKMHITCNPSHIIRKKTDDSNVIVLE